MYWALVVLVVFLCYTYVMVTQQILEQLQKVLSEMGLENIAVTLERPGDATHGDFATSVALAVSKQLGRSPMDVAEEILEKFNAQRATLKVIERSEIVRPGFINFFLSQEYLIEQVKRLVTDKPEITDSKQKVIVEYSSPNIAKPFTVGHLRSTIIGDAIANLLEATGSEVYRDNHIGDWGTQFGKQIYAIKTWGNEEEIAASDRPVKLLVDLYVKFHEEAEKDPSLEDAARAWFKKLEDGDTEAKDLWKKCIDWSWKEFEAIYAQLGVPSSGKPFENNGRGYGEAYFEDKMGSVLKELDEKGLLKEGKEGAKIVEFAESSKLPPLMILKKDGATLYATRDLATDRFRLFEKYGQDTMIVNEVGAEQSLYFRQLYTLEEKLGWVKKGQRMHVGHGHFRFEEGKMSTRKGNVIWLEDVLAEALQRALQLKNHESPLRQGYEGQARVNSLDSAQGKNHEETAKIVAIGAIKWNDLKRTSAQDVVFDWDDLLSMQGNSGPYIQYVAVRCKGVLTKAGVRNNDVLEALFDTEKRLETEELLLLRKLVSYQEVLGKAAETFAPHILCTYLFELAQTFNLFYQKVPILKASEHEKTVRLFLTHATGIVITRGLQVLGITVPERM